MLRRTAAAPRGQFLLMLHDLAIELVDQAVDRGIHVFVQRLGKQVAPAHMYACFGFALRAFDRQNDANIDNMVEMARYSVELRGEIVADRGGYLQMMAGDI